MRHWTTSFRSVDTGLREWGLKPDPSSGNAAICCLFPHVKRLGKPGDPPRAPAMSAVFLVKDIADETKELAARGVIFPDGIVEGEIGRVAKFSDPVGHSYFLYEPSATALSWPSGAVIKSLQSELPGAWVR